jgi:hypothetical protein
MRLKDIFVHPWVLENERELKEVKKNGANGAGFTSYNDRLVANMIEDLTPKIKFSGQKNGINEVEVRKKISDEDEKEMTSEADIIFKVKKKKKKSKKENIGILTGGVGGDLFDSILDKVKDKNKGKEYYKIRKEEKEKGGHLRSKLKFKE